MLIVNRDQLKDQILRADGRIASVSFVKKDGTLRTMTTKRTNWDKYIDPDADPIRSNAARHALDDKPNMIRVVEYFNHGQVRTIDLDRVKRIRVNGETLNVQPVGTRFLLTDA